MGTALTLAAIGAGVGYLTNRLWNMEERLVALNDAQQTELLAAVAQVGTDVGEAADRVAELVANQNIDDPEVTQAISDLRAVGQRADEIGATSPTPDETPVGEPGANPLGP